MVLQHLAPKEVCTGGDILGLGIVAKTEFGWGGAFCPGQREVLWNGAFSLGGLTQRQQHPLLVSSQPQAQLKTSLCRSQPLSTTPLLGSPLVRYREAIASP